MFKVSPRINGNLLMIQKRRNWATDIALYSFWYTPKKCMQKEMRPVLYCNVM